MRQVAVVVLAAAALTGCGGDDPAVPAGAGAQLNARVAAIRQAATAGDRSAAELRLSELRQAVGELQGAGELAESTASRILARAAVVEANLTSLTTTTTTTQPPEDHGDDKRKGDGDKDEEEEKKKEEEDD